MASPMNEQQDSHPHEQLCCQGQCKEVKNKPMCIDSIFIVTESAPWAYSLINKGTRPGPTVHQPPPPALLPECDSKMEMWLATLPYLHEKVNIPSVKYMASGIFPLTSDSLFLLTPMTFSPVISVCESPIHTFPSSLPEQLLYPSRLRLKASCPSSTQVCPCCPSLMCAPIYLFCSGHSLPPLYPRFLY